MAARVAQTRLLNLTSTFLMKEPRVTSLDEKTLEMMRLVSACGLWAVV